MPRAKFHTGSGWTDLSISGAVDFGGDRLSFGPGGEPNPAVSLFSNEVPATADAADGDQGYSMGTWMKSSVPGTVTHVRWIFPTNDQPIGTSVLANAFRTDSGVKAGGDDVIFTGTNGVWNTVALDTSFHVDADESFCPAIWTPRRYVATGGFFGAPFVNGVLSAEAVAGKFTPNNDPVLYLPASAFGNAAYHVDCLFVPD